MDNMTVIAERPAKTIYREGPYAVKVFKEDYSSSDVLTEAFNLAVVGETGFRVPKLEEVKKIDGKWAMVQQFIEGTPLAKMISDDPANAAKYLERLVDTQLEMHEYSAPRLRHHVEKMDTKIAVCGLDATSRYELRARLNGLPHHKKLCHGDLTPGNIIITPSDEAYVIDWAHATQGNASADAARTYLRFTLAGDTDHAEIYLDLFCKKSDTARQYVQKWLAIVAASQLVKHIPEERPLLLHWANVVEYV